MILSSTSLSKLNKTYKKLTIAGYAFFAARAAALILLGYNQSYLLLYLQSSALISSITFGVIVIALIRFSPSGDIQWNIKLLSLSSLLATFALFEMTTNTANAVLATGPIGIAIAIGLIVKANIAARS